MALNFTFEFLSHFSRRRDQHQWTLVVFNFKFYSKIDTLSLKTERTEIIYIYCIYYIFVTSPSSSMDIGCF